MSCQIINEGKSSTDLYYNKNAIENVFAFNTVSEVFQSFNQKHQVVRHQELCATFSVKLVIEWVYYLLRKGKCEKFTLKMVGWFILFFAHMYSQKYFIHRTHSFKCGTYKNFIVGDLLRFKNYISNLPTL